MKRPLSTVIVLMIASTAAAQQLPLSIHNVRVNADGAVECDLINHASLPATAWTLDVLVRGQNGGVVRHMRVATDMYVNDAYRGLLTDEVIGRKFLLPETLHPFSIAGTFAEPPELSVAAVVLDDGTALGESVALDQAFKQRIAERDSRRRALAQLQDVRRSKSGIDALVEAKARMAVPTPNELGANVWAGVEQNLSMQLARAQVGRANADTALSTAIDMLEREYRAAVKHSARRNGGL